MDGSILTFTGKRFYPLNPNPADIDPIDIAHALGNQCRYTGHTKFHYSVATHSVLMHDWGAAQGQSSKICLQLLMHDASEAYMIDLAAPLKNHAGGFGTLFLEAEHKLERAVAARFDLEHPFDPYVKEIDLQIRETEMSQLMPPVDWRDNWGEPLPITIPEWDGVESKWQMIWRMEDHGLVSRDSAGEFHGTQVVLAR